MPVLLDNYLQGPVYGTVRADIFALSTASGARDAPLFFYYSYDVIYQYQDVTLTYFATRSIKSATLNSVVKISLFKLIHL